MRIFQRGESESKPGPTVPPGLRQSATIVLRRTQAHGDRLRAYKLVVDDKTIGRIKDGETKSFEIEAGSHEACLKLDWVRSDSLTFSVGAGEEIRLRCGQRVDDYIKKVKDESPLGLLNPGKVVGGLPRTGYMSLELDTGGESD